MDEASTTHSETLKQMEFLKVIQGKIEPKLKVSIVWNLLSLLLSLFLLVLVLVLVLVLLVLLLLLLLLVLLLLLLSAIPSRSWCNPIAST